MEEQPPEDEHREQASGASGEDEGIIGEINPEEPADEPSPEETRRPRRGRSRFIGCLLALLGALAGGALAVWVSRDALIERPPVQGAEITQPADETVELPANRLVFSPTPERPDETPDIITAETNVIYCFYDLGRLPVGAPLSARWSYEGESRGDLPLTDLQRDPEADYARGRFQIHPPASASEDDATTGFPPGTYQVELTSPDYPDITGSGSFMALPRAAQILQGGGEPEGPPVIRSLQTATGVTDEGEPVDPGATFPPDVGQITAVFTYKGIAPGSVLTARWHVGDRELTRARAEIPITAPEGWAEAWLKPGDGAELPSGEYRVTIHLGDDDKPLASTGFSIEEPAPRLSPTS